MKVGGGGEAQIGPSSQEKLPSKSPALLGLKELSFKFRYCKHVILIMQIIICIIINMDDIRQEMLSKGLILKLNKRLK